MSTYIQPYKKPNKEGELNKCEFIKEMRKAYFPPPKQTEKSCYGYRNQYTGDASLVCDACQWFSNNGGDSLDERNGTD